MDHVLGLEQGTRIVGGQGEPKGCPYISAQAEVAR